MNRHLYSVLIVVLTIVSCSVQEMDSFDISVSENVFHARIESPANLETKAYVDDRLKVLWDENDRVSIFNQYTFNQEYKFNGKTGDNAGTFTMIPNDDFVTGNALDLVFSVYPYSEETRIDNDGVLSLILPARQTYRKNSFGRGANTMISCT